MDYRGYCLWVKTIEAIRMANYRRLVSDLQGDGDVPMRPPDIARALGISKVYAWQLENGKRTAIESKAARLMERKAGKPEGWMDTDFELWPFPDRELLGRVERLKHDDRVEIQGIIKDKILRLENNSHSGKSSGYQHGASQRAA